MTDYLARLLQAHLQGAFKPGEIVKVTVVHDDDCPRLQGGTCTCQPDLTTSAPDGVRDIDADGNPSLPARNPL